MMSITAFNIFTGVYKDAVTGKQVVSIAVPFKNSAGNFAGVCCEDVALDVLGELAKKINWQGEGFGYIVQSDGKILATSNANETSETALQSEILGKNFQKMLQDGKGYFVNDSQVFGYTTIESTGWIMIVSAPEEIVFAKIDSLRGNFLLMTLFGIAVIIVMMIFCVRFSSRLVKNIFAISDHAAEISKGNLKLQDIEINSEDEMDKLGKSFNKMRKNISQLIAQTISTARNVATSAEELTTGAQQMANSSTEVAQSVDEVVQGMIEQEKSVRDARLKSDEVFSKMNQLTEQMTQVLNKTGETQENAKSGGELMNNAIAKMNAIEERVNVAAQVVDKLGESSQQIGQIVDAISRIADQTNLLALNAAIEAARAGEHGRGFAVVAEEVRKLAAESQVSAEQIKNLIETIRTDTEQAVTAMATGTGEVKEGTEFIHSVGAQFENILDMVTESKAEIDGMARKISDMSSDTKTIDDAIKIIDEITHKTANNTKSISTSTEQQSASSEEIAAASQTLLQIADELQKAVNKFKI